ncbi:MAG TPA: hypothetical protein VHD56_13760 [Tepidisphaeraceae bacterium]|nr:hypothetical protein [Tepidisphaeraceae bacterium]
MRSIQRLSMICLLALLAAGPELPTMNEIQADFDAKRYTDVIRKVVNIVQLRGNAAASYDKHLLYTLRAESHLRLKQFSAASEAYAAAAKESKDEKSARWDSAMALLIKRSPQGMYMPKQPSTRPADVAQGGKAPPINITDATMRQQALEALFNDEYKAQSTKFEQLGRSQSVMPLMAGMKQVGGIRDLELAATGSDAKSKKILTDIASKAGQLMSSAVKQMAENVQQISDTANQSSDQIVNIPGGGTQVLKVRRGLNSNDIAALNDVIDTSRTIAEACDAIGEESQAAGPLAAVGKDATKLADQAEMVLKTDYATSGSTPPQIVTPPAPGQRGAPGQGTYR